MSTSDTQTPRSLIEVQFPIGPLSLESYKERDAKGSKLLSSLGKWWGGKPLVLVRAIVIGSVFPAAEDPADWPNDLDIFLRCLTLDNAGMWRRKTATLPAALCWPQASGEEREALFADPETWRRGRVDRTLRQALERRVFYTLPYPEQRDYCCRVEQIDGPPPESWAEINAYLGTNAETLSALVQQLAERRYGRRLKVGDAFCGGGSIPFEAAELGCDVYASDLNPVACLVTWGALNIIGGTDAFREQIHAEQRRVYDEVDSWILEQGLETSAEGWRAEAYLYCIEMTVPEWDGWRVPICPSWVIAPKTETWVELVPVEAEKRFDFKVRRGGTGYRHASEGTKQDDDVVCPPSLWAILRRDSRHQGTARSIPYNQLIENAGGLRPWENDDVVPRPGDVLQERLYCIRWRLPRFSEVLRAEQSTPEGPVAVGTEPACVIEGLRHFLQLSQAQAMDKLRQRNWRADQRELELAEAELAGLLERREPSRLVAPVRERVATLRAREADRRRTLQLLDAAIPVRVYREPMALDLDLEQRALELLREFFHDWQAEGWIPSWRIEPGEKTYEPIRTRGWTHWHHLFNPRQLLLQGLYSKEIAANRREVRRALLIAFGRLVEANARLVRWKQGDGGGVGGTVAVYYNQALNTLFNYAARSWKHLLFQTVPDHLSGRHVESAQCSACDARDVSTDCELWITDPPYADAVNYEELSEFFLAWYAPHLKAAFPDWHTDSMRNRAVKGEDAPFRIAMAECYRNLTEHMPDDGMQVLMFTHKSTDVWEDLALIMWAAGLQVKQVWSVATETPGAGIRTGNYVQATYNMVLRKRTGGKVGFVDFITPQVKRRVTEVITRMRESQVDTGLPRCGYTDTDYLLAAQAVAAEVVTGYANIDGVDLDAELRTPNRERGRSALRTLMDNAKRTATDFLVPPAMDHAIDRAGAGVCISSGASSRVRSSSC